MSSFYPRQTPLVVSHEQRGGQTAAVIVIGGDNHGTIAAGDLTNNLVVAETPPRPDPECRHCGARRWVEKACYYCGEERH